MAIINDNDMFRKPRPDTLKADLTSKVSRCAVCMRRRITETVRRPPPPSPQIYYPELTELERRSDFPQSVPQPQPVPQPVPQSRPPPRIRQRPANINRPRRPYRPRRPIPDRSPVTSIG